VKNQLKNYLLNFKNILLQFTIFNLLFLIFYKSYFYYFLINITSAKSESMDVDYYREIFDNLNYAVVFVALILIIILVWYEKIKNYWIYVFTNKNLLIFCIASNIIIQILLIIFITTQPISDSKHYIDNAIRLSETGSYINSYGNLTAFWTVGLPAYLAFLKMLSADYIFIAKLVNILISTGLIVLCYFIFKNYLTPSALNVYLIIFTFFPNNLLSSNVILTDYPFTFFLWGSVLVIIKVKENSSLIFAILIGFLLTLGSFLRPAGLLLPLLFAGIIYFEKYPLSVKRSVIIFSTFLLLLLPWGIRNYYVFKSIVPVSTNGGYIFLMGNHKNSSGGVNFDFQYDMSNPDEAEESREAFNKGFIDIINNPLESLIRIPKKILNIYYRGDSSVTWSLKKLNKDIPQIIKSMIFYSANLFFYIIIILNLIVFIFFTGRGKIKKYRILIAISVYMIMIIIIFVGSERYHIPLLPIHIFLAAKYFEAKIS